MCEPSPSEYSKFKADALRRHGGDAKLARARSLLYSMLWNLDAKTPPALLNDCFELLRFELARRLAEPK